MSPTGDASPVGDTRSSPTGDPTAGVTMTLLR